MTKKAHDPTQPVLCWLHGDVAASAGTSWFAIHNASSSLRVGGEDEMREFSAFISLCHSRLRANGKFRESVTLSRGGKITAFGGGAVFAVEIEGATLSTGVQFLYDLQRWLAHVTSGALCDTLRDDVVYAGFRRSGPGAWIDLVCDDTWDPKFTIWTTRYLELAQFFLEAASQVDRATHVLELEQGTVTIEQVGPVWNSLTYSTPDNESTCSRVCRSTLVRLAQKLYS